MAIFGLSKKGRYLENWQEAFELASTITAADVGKAVTVDTAAPKRVKLAGDGDTILGRLEVVEIRTQEDFNIGTVSLKGFNWFPVKASLSGVNIPLVGDTIVGAGAGEVKARTDANDGTTVSNNIKENFVQMVDTGKVFVIYQ